MSAIVSAGARLLTAALIIAGTADAKTAGRANEVGSIHRHVEVAESAPHAYSIQMGGLLDGLNTRGPVGGSPYEQAFEPNLAVRMENVGATTLVNPWLIANGKDWRTVESIVASIVSLDMSDSEKAIALWDFQVNYRFHATTYDDDIRDAVKMYNVYGYTLCGDDAVVLADLWRTAGLRTRRGFPAGHSTSEVFFDGGWRLLDGDENVFYLMRDNRTIAGEEDLVRDPDLVKRTHTYGILQAENRLTDEFTASLFHYEGDRSAEPPSHMGHAMNLKLRPGEALEWRWDFGG